MDMRLSRAAIPHFREEVRAARIAVHPSQRALATRAVTDLVGDYCRSSGLHLNPGRLGAYMPADGEISPEYIVEWFRGHGWTTWVPIVGDEGTMTFGRFDEGCEMAANRFGIPEPVEPPEVLEAHEMDVVIVPCVAVDRRGNRLGLGAGYYDRALAPRADEGSDAPGRSTSGENAPTANAPRSGNPRTRPLLITIGFELQLVEEMETDPWDVPMDVVVSDERVILVEEDRRSG